MSKSELQDSIQACASFLQENNCLTDYLLTKLVDLHDCDFCYVTRADGTSFRMRPEKVYATHRVDTQSTEVFVEGRADSGIRSFYCIDFVSVKPRRGGNHITVEVVDGKIISDIDLTQDELDVILKEVECV